MCGRTKTTAVGIRCGCGHHHTVSDAEATLHATDVSEKVISAVLDFQELQL